MRIDIRECDDWIAIYKDGNKVQEGHSCTLSRGLEALGIAFSCEWFEYTGYGSDPFPEVLP